MPSLLFIRAELDNAYTEKCTAGKKQNTSTTAPPKHMTAPQSCQSTNWSRITYHSSIVRLVRLFPGSVTTPMHSWATGNCLANNTKREMPQRRPAMVVRRCPRGPSHDAPPSMIQTMPTTPPRRPPSIVPSLIILGGARLCLFSCFVVPTYPETQGLQGPHVRSPRNPDLTRYTIPTSMPRSTSR